MVRVPYDSNSVLSAMFVAANIPHHGVVCKIAMSRYSKWYCGDVVARKEKTCEVKVYALFCGVHWPVGCLE